MPHLLGQIASHAPKPPAAPWLQGILAAAHDHARLCEALRTRSVADLPHAPRAEAGAGYGRAVLHCDARLEIMHAGWQAGGRAEPHDHGAACGAVLVLAGRFVETSWQLARGQLLAVNVQERAAGDLLPVRPGLIHSLDALAPGATLHVYTPPVAGMRIYDRTARHLLTVPDDAGAWLPATRVLARRSFAEACDDAG